ncbi:MAG: nucleoside deaminase [Candidatus Omnitrophica bacterium]|nr:nucleoside deaminase [Candidatus Omnitrophota bacterium]
MAKYMLLAIKEAEKNYTKLEGGPFGACIVKKGGSVIAVSRNTVLKNDAICHAEINAIRLASKKLKTFDLSSCIMYSTTEPCPMCFSAIHWARIDKIIYGASMADAKKAGFNELSITAKKVKLLGKSRVKIQGGFMSGQCRKLFTVWKGLPRAFYY